MKKFLAGSLFAAAIVFGFGAQAHAMSVQASAPSGFYTLTTYGYTIDPTSTYELTNTTTGAHKAPANIVGNYYSVGAGQSMTLNFTYNPTTVTIDWGSVDSYNNISVTEANGTVFTGTLTYVLQALGYTTGFTGSTGEDTLATFTSDVGIKSITFTSSSNALEFAVIGGGEGEAPLPAALPLFGTALLGLRAAKRSKKAK